MLGSTNITLSPASPTTTYYGQIVGELHRAERHGQGLHAQGQGFGG
jgi:hypothetical protein